MENVKAYKYTIACALLILLAILTPGEDIPSVGIPNLDKVVHLGMFGCLTLCFHMEGYKKQKKGILFMPIVIVEIYAILTELLQMLIPGRSCSMLDFLADSLGVLLASLVMWRFIKWKN